MTLAIAIPQYEPTTGEIAEATGIAKAIVGIAKARALDLFRTEYGREPLRLPSAIRSKDEYARAVQANADAHEYNASLTALTADAFSLYLAAAGTWSTPRLRLPWIASMLPQIGTAA